MRSLEGKVWAVQSPSHVDWYMCNWLINVVGNNDVNIYIEVHSIGTNFQAAWFDLWLLRYQIFFRTNKLSEKSYRLSPFYNCTPAIIFAYKLVLHVLISLNY